MTQAKYRPDEEVEELIRQVQEEGSEEAKLDILYRFGYRPSEPFTRFLKKYYDILVTGRIDLRDKDTVRFINLYEKDARQRFLNRQTRRSNKTISRIYSVAGYIKNQCERLGAKEIRDELTFLLVEKIHKFKKIKERIGFEGYVYATFHFSVYAYLSHTIFSKDMMDTPEMITYLDEENIADIPDERFISGTLYVQEKGPSELPFEWTLGDCHEIYEELTPFQRNLLRLHDYEGYRDEEIADLLGGYHLNSIFLYRQTIKKKLEEEREWMEPAGWLDDL